MLRAKPPEPESAGLDSGALVAALLLKPPKLPLLSDGLSPPVLAGAFPDLVKVGLPPVSFLSKPPAAGF